ncbi:MAG: hypothetical protein RLY86_3291 [Pseudomonadota bacterium]|jgi:hypothetical protein
MLETPDQGVMTANGFEMRPGVWRAPATVPLSIRQEANSRAAEISAHLGTPASRDSLKRWLGSLAALVAGNMPIEELQIRAGAYSDLLDVPGVLLTKATLKAAAARFRFFPSFEEVNAFFGERTAALRVEMDKCRALARPKADRVEEWRPPTEDEKEAVAAMLDQAIPNRHQLTGARGDVSDVVVVGRAPEWASLGGAARPEPKPSDERRYWRHRLDRYHAAGEWPLSCGPKPGEPGCRVPADLLTRAEAVK